MTGRPVRNEKGETLTVSSEENGSIGITIDAPNYRATRQIVLTLPEAIGLAASLMEAGGFSMKVWPYGWPEPK